MLDKNSIIDCINQNKNELIFKYHLNKIGLFGSYVRDEQKKDSDVDILVDFAVQPDLFTFFELEEELEKKLSAKVDLVNQKGIKPALVATILEEVRYL